MNTVTNYEQTNQINNTNQKNMSANMIAPLNTIERTESDLMMNFSMTNFADNHASFIKNLEGLSRKEMKSQIIQYIKMADIMMSKSKEMKKQLKLIEKAEKAEAKKLEKDEEKTKKAEAKKLEKAKKAEAKKLEKAKKAEAKKLEKAKAKANKPKKKSSIDNQLYTKKCLVPYRDSKDSDALLGKNGSRLRFARLKDGSGPVIKVMEENWTDEANKFWDSLDNKWERSALPYSPEKQALIDAKNQARTEALAKKKTKKQSKKKKAVKKVIETVAVDDTDDDENVEYLPKGYSKFRKWFISEKSSETKWKKCDKKTIERSEKAGMQPHNEWKYAKTASGSALNGKIYSEEPNLTYKLEKVDEGVDIKDSEGNIVGNHVESFTPVDEKATETLKSLSNDNCDIEIAASELKCLKQPATSLENSEYGSDGFKEFSHFSIGSGMTPLKINRKLAVYYASMEIANENGSEGDDFIGYYNENTGEIVDELDSSDDEIVEHELDEEELSDSDPDDELGFGDENNVVDTETF